MLSRRTLSLLLCLVVIFSLCALPAQAEESAGADKAETAEDAGSVPEKEEKAEADSSTSPADDQRRSSAPARPTDDTSTRTVSGPIIVEAGSVYYSDGQTVYNNGGTVFNNGGTIYNNEGTVYNNSGVVYNNNGTVFNNGAEVYNNGGSVIGTGGIVHDNGGEFEDARHAGLFTVRPSADYSSYAAFEGAERDSKGSFRMEEGDRLVIRPVKGLIIEAATTTAGSCALSSEGSAVLERVDRDGELTLRFVPERPEAQPAAGAYGDKIAVELRASDAAAIYYTLDGSAPDEQSIRYDAPVSLGKSCVLRAVAVLPNGEMSRVTEQVYIFPILNPILFTPVSEGYDSVGGKYIQIQNTGAASVQIMSVRLEGKNADCFTLSTVKGARIPGGQTARNWTVTPKAGLEAGKYEAEVVVAYANASESRTKLSFTVLRQGGAA